MSKIKFIIYCAVLNCAVFFLSPLDFLIRFLATAILLFFGGIYLLKNSPFENRKKTLLYVFGLWISVISIPFISSFFISGFLGTSFFIISLFSTVLAILFYKKEGKALMKISLSYIFLIGLLTFLLPNYYAYTFKQENKTVNKPLPDLKLYGENGSLFDLKKEKGKILVFDLWSSSCGNCIKAFPKFDELRKEFKNDTTIVFYSINFPLLRDVDKKDHIKKFTEKFSFTKLYADNNASKLLRINKVPQYMIVDKNQTVKYIGTLNTENGVFYDNFYDLLNEIK